MHTMMHVREFPHREFLRSFVKGEFLYGMWLWLWKVIPPIVSVKGIVVVAFEDAKDCEMFSELDEACFLGVIELTLSLLWCLACF